MKVQILGRGCPKCKKLEENTRDMLEQMEEEEDPPLDPDDIKIEKIYDLQKASSMGMMSAPGLAIDGELKKQGNVLNPGEIREVIEDEA
ncbi:MAG: thioredoxin family protein [Candidatus Nanohaloarchaea archaeon]|nr:thioredoxin family protein [Candidatus Nanohaloarchaea archaeon]